MIEYNFSCGLVTYYFDTNKTFFVFLSCREVDSDEDKQNKYEVSFTTRRWRSYYIFFFFDSKIHLFKKRKRIKYSKVNIIALIILFITLNRYCDKRSEDEFSPIIGKQQFYIN